MNSILDICNTPIDIATVSDYSIIETSYIFRPVFVETKPKIFSSSERYRFSHNIPYGAIVDQKGHIQKTDASVGKTTGENILIDLGSALIDKAGEKSVDRSFNNFNRYYLRLSYTYILASISLKHENVFITIISLIVYVVSISTNRFAAICEYFNSFSEIAA